MQPTKQSEMCLPPRPADEVLRERLEAELRDAIFEFNAIATEPADVVVAIRRVREIRERLRGVK